MKSWISNPLLLTKEVKMYNLTTNREIMSPSERIENAEASCESINDHIDSIGEFWKILHRALEAFHDFFAEKFEIVYEITYLCW